MAIDKTEWELLNAYADGELSAAAAKALELRLSQNPVLALELEKISALKASLAKLKAAPVQAPVSRTSIGWIRHAAAAVILLLIGATAFFWNEFQQNQALDPLEIHTAYAQETYILSDAKRPVHVSSTIIGDFYIPDLQASELQLADTQLKKVGKREVVSAHFRGIRGCRLTLVGSNIKAADNTSANIQFSLDRTDRLLLASWQSGGSHFTLLASAMDANRFKAIAHYVQNDVQNEHSKQQQDLRIAMQRTYEMARPCA